MKFSKVKQSKIKTFWRVTCLKRHVYRWNTLWLHSNQKLFSIKTNSRYSACPPARSPSLFLDFWGFFRDSGWEIGNLTHESSRNESDKAPKNAAAIWNLSLSRILVGPTEPIHITKQIYSCYRTFYWQKSCANSTSIIFEKEILKGPKYLLSILLIIIIITIVGNIHWVHSKHPRKAEWKWKWFLQSALSLSIVSFF